MDLQNLDLCEERYLHRMDQFRNPDLPDPDEFSSKILCHCETLKQLLGELPLPSPPQDEIVEILKSNVQLFAAFIELEAEPLVDNVSLNQQPSHKNVDESRNGNEVQHPLREPNSSLFGRPDYLPKDEKRTENYEKPSKSDSDLKVTSEPPVTINHSLILTHITDRAKRVKSQPSCPSSSIVESSAASKVPSLLDLQPQPDKAASAVSVSTLPSLSYSQPYQPVRAKNVFLPKQMENFAKEYQRIYQLDPKSLLPFQPINKYPFKYAVAQYTFFHGDVSQVLFVRNTLMLGDGYVYGVGKITSKTYGSTLDPLLYNSSLSISQLAEAIRRFPRLPAKVLLSIGNYDGLYCNDIYAVRRQYLDLLQTLRSLGVRRLHVLPLMNVPGASPYYQAVAEMVMSDWSTPFGGEYACQHILIQKALICVPKPKLGFDSLQNDWRKIVEAIRNYYITCERK
ncbi:uncharacterized protein LOC135843788 [Planococcus citri]|uniref:uncharacterized protein LOC135843788 n=1 Tax=Planococcus citri TaxID=170843 RepID=UPI0031F8C8B1